MVHSRYSSTYGTSRFSSCILYNMILKQWVVQCQQMDWGKEISKTLRTSCIHVRVTIVGLGDVLSSVNLMRSAWSSSRLIRSLDNQFLKNLNEKWHVVHRLQEYPQLLLCIRIWSNQLSSTSVLAAEERLQIWGARGQHTSQTRAELHQEQSNNPLFATILAEVYVGLSDDEVLRLASRHNINGHYIHKMTHRDYISAAILYLQIYPWS